MRGKNKCKILKQIRQKIADENDIPLVTKECTYQGECSGTCPKCEAELRYLEQQLARRQQLGKTVTVAALSVSLMAGLTACPDLHKTGELELAPNASRQEDDSRNDGDVSTTAGVPDTEPVEGEPTAEIVEGTIDPEWSENEYGGIEETEETCSVELVGEFPEYPIAGMIEAPTDESASEDFDPDDLVLEGDVAYIESEPDTEVGDNND